MDENHTKQTSQNYIIIASTANNIAHSKYIHNK